MNPDGADVAEILIWPYLAGLDEIAFLAEFQ